MRKSLTLLAMLCVLGLGVGEANAVTKTFNWTWPTTRTDGTTLALSSIGGFTIWDTSAPLPGSPGTSVACPTTIPPTTATGTCQANVMPGHSFVATYTDNSVPPDASAVSNTVTVPLSAPSAITNLTVQ